MDVSESLFNDNSLLRSVRDADRERALKEGGAPLARVAGRALKSLRRR